MIVGRFIETSAGWRHVTFFASFEGEEAGVKVTPYDLDDWAEEHGASTTQGHVSDLARCLAETGVPEDEARTLADDLRVEWEARESVYSLGPPPKWYDDPEIWAVPAVVVGLAAVGLAFLVRVTVRALT